MHPTHQHSQKSCWRRKGKGTEGRAWWENPFGWIQVGWAGKGCSRQEGISGTEQCWKGEFRWIPAWKEGMVGRGTPGKGLDMAEMHQEHPGSVLREFLIPWLCLPGVWKNHGMILNIPLVLPSSLKTWICSLIPEIPWNNPRLECCGSGIPFSQGAEPPQLP